jgi:hypothetical protein
MLRRPDATVSFHTVWVDSGGSGVRAGRRVAASLGSRSGMNGDRLVPRGIPVCGIEGRIRELYL